MNLAPYKKFIVAVVGAIIIGVNQFFGLEIGVDAQQVVNIVVPVLTALGVYQVDNGPSA